MKILLDTNAFLAIAFDQKLPPEVRRLLRKQNTEMLLSIVTPWEIAIKSSTLPNRRTKLGLTQRHVRQAIEAIGVRLIAITLDHIEALQSLPALHADPFDRMIIAQALEERCPIVSSDQRFPAYEVQGLKVIWN